MNYIKRFPFYLGLSLVMLCQALLPVQAQRGNQSDVTGAIVTTSDIKGPFFNSTPERGSQVEFSSGLRRVVSKVSVKEVAAWELRTNQGDRTVDWQFTTADARIKLKRLYPSIIS